MQGANTPGAHKQIRGRQEEAHEAAWVCWQNTAYCNLHQLFKWTVNNELELKWIRVIVSLWINEYKRTFHRGCFYKSSGENISFFLHTGEHMQNLTMRWEALLCNIPQNITSMATVYSTTRYITILPLWDIYNNLLTFRGSLCFRILLHSTNLYNEWRWVYLLNDSDLQVIDMLSG